MLDENRRNGLKELAHLVGIQYDKYQAHKKYKGFKNEEILGSTLQDAAIYAMTDVEVTWKLYELFKPALEHATEPLGDRLYSVFKDIWMPLSVVLRKMERKGIAIDRDQVIALKDEYEILANEAKHGVLREGYRMLLSRWESGESIPNYYIKQVPAELHTSVVERADGTKYVDLYDLEIPVWKPTERSNERFIEFNPASPSQMKELLYDYSGIQLDADYPLRYTKNGDLAVDKDNLKILIYYIKDDIPPFVNALLKWKEYDKFISTYLNRLIQDTTEDYVRIHGNFNQAANDQGKGGTVTGRLSSSNPNMQNIPSRDEIGERSRKLFVAGPNSNLIVADYNNFEMRLLGHYSNDQVIINAFAEGKDLHITMGAQLLGTEYDSLLERYVNGDPDAKRFRSLGKTLNFGITYGLGAKKLVRFLLVNNEYEISIDEAKRWIQLYDELYAGAYEWKARVRDFVRQHGYVATLYGRKRRLPGAFSRDRMERGYAERQAINTIIQGSCGDIICKAMVALQPCLEGLGGSLLLQVHDELLAEVPEGMEEMAKRIMETEMVGFVNPILRCPLLVEAHHGKNWYEAK